MNHVIVTEITSKIDFESQWADCPSYFEQLTDLLNRSWSANIVHDLVADKVDTNRVHSAAHRDDLFDGSIIQELVNALWVLVNETSIHT